MHAQFQYFPANFVYLNIEREGKGEIPLEEKNNYQRKDNMSLTRFLPEKSPNKKLLTFYAAILVFVSAKRSSNRPKHFQIDLNDKILTAQNSLKGARNNCLIETVQNSPNKKRPSNLTRYV